MLRRFHPHILFTVLTASVLAPIAHSRDLAWAFDPPLGDADSSPGIADMNGDGKDDVVVTTTAGMTIAIDHEGHQIWMSGVQVPISIAPTVVDLIEDPTPEVLVLNQAGRLYCLSGKTGDPIWQFDLEGRVVWGTTAIAATDLDGDGALEIVVGDDQGHVVCLTNEGDLRWQYAGEHGVTSCPAIGILGDDKTPSIVVGGSKVPLVCLNADGTERWRLKETGIGSSPVIADLAGNGQGSIVSAVGNDLVRVDATGVIQWRHTMRNTIDSSIAVADANEDGLPEIYAVDLSGTFVSLSPDGTPYWTADLRERARRSPAIADIDGDGALDIVVAGYAGELFVFTPQGELKESMAMPRTNATPAIADFAGDGTPYVVFVEAEANVRAYRWPGAKPNAKAPWPAYRASAGRTGTPEAAQAQSGVTIAVIDFGQFYAGSNTFVATIANPAGNGLRVEVTVRQGEDEPRMRAFESPEKSLEVEFDYSLSSDAPLDLAIECRVLAGDSVVARRAVETHVIPFQKELRDLGRLADRLAASARALPAALALVGEAASLRERLAQYAAGVPAAGTMDGVERRALRDALRTDLDRFARLTALADAAALDHAAQKWPLTLSAANPWAPFGGMDEVLEGRFSGEAMNVSAFPGETETTALNVVNWSGVGKTVRVEFDALVRDGGGEASPVNAIDIHEVLAVPTQSQDFSNDALPRINGAQTLTVPGWDARQLWFNVKTASLAPGAWTTTVHLRTLEPDSKSFSLPLTITIWDTPLADTDVFKSCNWAYVHNSRLKEHEPDAIADLVAHGTNVFVTSFTPRATFDEQGKLVGAIDFADHDRFVQQYAKHGIILFQNLGAIGGPGGMDGDAYKKAYIPWMRAWVAHLKELGIGYDGFAMYPVDEPGLSAGLVDLYLNNAKLTREADPKVRMYTDPVERILAEELTEMVPYVDIWCPNRNGFLLNKGADKLAIMKNSGAEMWTYECEGNAKHQSPLGYYRGLAWLSWHHGLTGFGFWSYSTSVADPWYRPKDTLDYLLSYQGDGVVSSKRWEAVRDGVEDYAMLHALREKLAAMKSSGGNLDANLVRDMEAVLGASATGIAQFCGLDKDGTVPGKHGDRGERKVADRRFAAIEEVRAEIARLLR